GRIYAGEVWQLAGPALCVEALGVPILTNGEGSAHEDLDELARLNKATHGRPLGPERGDERAEQDEPRVDEELCDLSHATDVLEAVGRGETEVLVEPVTDVVAVEKVGVRPAARELDFDQIGNRRFAGSGQAGEPKYAGSVSLERGA